MSRPREMKDSKCETIPSPRPSRTHAGKGCEGQRQKRMVALWVTRKTWAGRVLSARGTGWEDRDRQTPQADPPYFLPVLTKVKFTEHKIHHLLKRFFLTWTISFKVLIEFVTYNIASVLQSIFFSFWPRGIWDLIFPTRN